MKKRILCLMTAFFGVFILLSSCGEKKADEDYVGSVNSIPITQDEIDYFAKQMRTNVITKYVNDYDVEYSDNFWSQDVSGVTPEKYLFDVAFDECVRAKVQLIKCKEYGIYDDISYSALKSKAETFNKENEGKKTVGITSIDTSVFYTYYIETGVLALKNKLVENKVIDDESEYDSYIDSLIKDSDIVKNR